jgi:bacterioferritin-associated ferredoxin
MYVCICEAVTEKEILRQVREEGVKTVRSLGRATGACRQCGKCAADARSLIKSCIHQGKEQNAQRAA